MSAKEYNAGSIEVLVLRTRSKNAQECTQKLTA